MNAPEKAPELLPCPFCGGMAKLLHVADEHWILCTCQASGPMHSSESQAIAAWNRSAPQNRAPQDEEMTQEQADKILSELPPSFFKIEDQDNLGYGSEYVAKLEAHIKDLEFQLAQHESSERDKAMCCVTNEARIERMKHFIDRVAKSRLLATWPEEGRESIYEDLRQALDDKERT